MNRKTQYYSQVKNLLEGLIALPETDENEDQTLKAILGLMTDMIGKQSTQPEESMPLQQPAQPMQMNDELVNTFNLARRKVGGF